MNIRLLPSLTLSIALLASAAVPRATAAEPVLAPNARLAIVGDSITEQKIYSKFIETYLLACAGRQDVSVFQYGWGGETARGFADRMDNDLTGFKPTVVTLCYGMNDGQYRPYVDEIGRGYESAMRKVLTGLQRAGVEKVVVGSPGAVDTRYFINNRFAPLSGAEGYNVNLGRLRDIDRALAEQTGQIFADMHQPMVDTMAKAKTALGNDYDVCGRDGVHPGPNGHLIMAYAFLRGLGCDGNLGEIVVDMRDPSTASGGHKVVNSSAGKAEIESARYPFCFDGDAKSPKGTRSITPFFPFNQELNRLTMKAKNLGENRAQVKWGNETKEFTRDQLEAGINLAAEFSSTPFDAQFRKVMDAVAAKQNFETPMIKSMVTQFRQFADASKNDPELANAFAAVNKRLAARQQDLAAAARAQLKPVTHTIEVIPVR
jgi:lysophospholipase L1-like esterase